MADEITPGPDAIAPQPNAEPDRRAQPVDDEQPPRLPFPVVGVGASAGGIEAFGEFLDAMPPDGGMAFVFVLHLSPDAESHLAEILGRRTAMPVSQVEDGMAVEVNHVYVIRPGHVLTVRDGYLRLGPELGGPRAANRPVDDLFRSLAEEQRERAVCVILSGMGSNGTAGAQAVKAVGGLCVAQDPESAQYPSMPRHLIDAGYADHILRPADIPEVLLSYAGSPYARSSREEDARTVIDREQQHLREVLAVLRTRARQDFTGYKKPTVLRRVQRRMGLARLASIAEYARHLRQTPAEVTALADDLLIHVTGFFRDPEAWDALRHHVVVPLVAGRAGGAAVRAWVAACSSGEEAYSLAMLLVEESERAEKPLDITVFATDLADRTLAHARTGVYPGGIESELSPERLERFFVREAEVYRVRPDLRDRVVFAPQNILSDPPFSRLDIATCRNLLIYLEPDVQKRVLELLHFGLREGGALFLGSSETAGGVDGLFEAVDKKARIFRRIGPTRHGAVDFPLPHPIASGEGRSARSAVGTLPPRSRRVDGPPASVAELSRQALLDAHTPPAVTVDRDGHVVYYHGDVGPFLRLSGEPTRDLLLLARDGVRGAARSALDQAAAKNARATAPDGWVERESGRRHRVAVTASPVADLDAGDHPAGYFVVSFDDRGEVAVPGAEGPPDAADGQGAEVRRLRGELQSTIEELQTSNEEQKAANEEAMSVNEELQSANEELETSKEEMQSLNEELSTVNAQLRAKMEEHQAASSDLSSLLTSTDIAVLFLDTTFRIRRFTPAARDLIDLIPGDVGRPVSALARKFDDPALDADCRAVLERLVQAERAVDGADGRHFQRRVTPYRTADSRIDGVVVTFVDVTDRHAAAQALAAEKKYSESIIETLHESLLVLHPDLTVKSANPAFYSHFRVDPAATLGRKVYHLGNGQWDIPALRTLLEDVLPDSNVFDDYEVAHEFEGLGRRVMLVNARRLDHVQLILLGLRDITSLKEAEAALRASEERISKLVALMPAAVYTCDAEGRLTFYNRRAAELWGREPRLGDEQEKYCGSFRMWTPDGSLIGHEECPMAPAVREGRAARNLEVVIEQPAGSRVVVNVNIDPLYDREGRLAGAINVFVDVTEGKRSEEALRRSEERLRLALAAARMGTWAWDPAGDAHRRDASLNVLLGLSAEETVSPLAEFLARMHPDDREPVRAAFDRSVRQGRPLNTEFRVVWPDGTVRWLRDQGDVFGDSAAGTRHMAGACVDVTERREAEEALRASEERVRLILESATDFAILTLAPDRAVTSWSPGAAAAFGYAADEIVGRSGDVLFTPEDRAAGAPGWEVGEAERAGRAADERWHFRKDGSRFYASGVMRPLKDGGGFVKVARDLTDRKRMEDEIRDARDKLEVRVAERTADLGRAMDALEAEMGRRRVLTQRLSTAQEDERRRMSRDLHDSIGQLMAGLSLAFKSIESSGDLPPPTAAKLVEAQRVMSDLGREVHGLAVRLRPTSLDDIGLESALGQLVSEWSSRSGVKSEFHASGLGPERLPAEVDTVVYRVVQEALTNVAKHAKATMVSVVVTRPDGHVSVAVEDNGVGFDPESSPKGRLGLLGMRERVELVGGRIDVESSSGSGTTVVAQIPIPNGGTS